MAEKDLKDIRMREALAFTLFKTLENDPQSSKSEDELIRIWQEVENKRVQYRALADTINNQLKKGGLGLKTSASSKLDKYLEIIMMRPAELSYSLPYEDARDN